jgi:phosphohistidine phosphatase
VTRTARFILPGEQLRDDGIAPDVVLTSPLLRARQTGEALAVATGSTSEPDERLAPGATAEGVREAVHGRGERVIVVGHQPDCGRIAAILGDGEEPRFPPAGMAVFEL